MIKKGKLHNNTTGMGLLNFYDRINTKFLLNLRKFVAANYKKIPNKKSKRCQFELENLKKIFKNRQKLTKP